MKNQDQLLPLDKTKIKSIAVIGPGADMVVSDWYAGTPPYRVTILDGIRNAVGEDVDRQAISIEQEDLVKLVKKANQHTILVMVSSFPYSINWSKEKVQFSKQITVCHQEFITVQLTRNNVNQQVLVQSLNLIFVLRNMHFRQI